MDLNNNDFIPIQSNQVSVIVFASPHSSSSNQTNSTKKKNPVEIIYIDDDLDLDSNQTKLVPHAALPIFPNQLEPQPPILSDSIIDYQKFDGIEIITIDDSDDDDDNIETNMEETLKSISIQQKNDNSTSDELIDINQICGNDIVASEANVAVESLVPETSSISFDLGGDFESVDHQNNTKLTSKTNNNNRKQHQIKSKRRGRGNSKLRNNNKRIESNEERQQRLEQCREFYGLRKRKQEEEPRNSQASSELNRVGQNGKLRSNRDIDNSTDIDIDNRATLESSGRRSDGGNGVETTNQQKHQSTQWKLLKIRETPEQRERRLARIRERRANETPKQRERRLAKIRECHKRSRANEPPEQREHRLALQSEYDKQRRANETPEKRKHRLKVMSEQNNKRIANETPEQRKCRVAAVLERYHRNKQKQQHSSTRKSNKNKS